MPVSILPFGKTSKGVETNLVILEGVDGTRAELTDLGACLVSLMVADGRGVPTDVVLGYPDPFGYEVNSPNFGAVVGRNANRIAGASFELGGRVHELVANEGQNSLHSGPDMYFQRKWDIVQTTDGDDGPSVTFALKSPDKDQGFPGELDVRVTYALAPGPSLSIGFLAQASEPTIVNLTNHSYFNLNGHGSGSVLGHTLSIAADAYAPNDETNVPLGDILPVAGTPMDFVCPRTIAEGLEQARTEGFEQILRPGGYDHNYVLSGFSPDLGALREVACLKAERSRISMRVLTDLPGMQLYTSNALEPEAGKDGADYGRHSAVCLETQFFPDAIHHPDWPQPVFGPERPFSSTTTFAFSTC